MKRFGIIVSIILSCCFIVACGKNDPTHKYESHSSISSEKSSSNPSMMPYNVFESLTNSKTNETMIQKNSSGSKQVPKFINFPNNQEMTATIDSYTTELKTIYGNDLVVDFETSLQNSHHVSFSYSGTVEDTDAVYPYPQMMKDGATLNIQNGDIAPLDSIFPMTEEDEKLIEQNLFNTMNHAGIDVSAVFLMGFMI